MICEICKKDTKSLTKNIPICRDCRHKKIEIDKIRSKRNMKPIFKPIIKSKMEIKERNNEETNINNDNNSTK